MHHIIDKKVICSECGGDDVEFVTYRWHQFARCRSCKHEGDKKSLLPEVQSSGSTIAELYRSRQDNQETF